MAPIATADITPKSQEPLTSPKLNTQNPEILTSSNTDEESYSPHREPLKLTGALDGFDYFEVTPCIGRQYRNVDLAEWLKAPNSDELLRDLAITSKPIPIFSKKAP